MGAADQAERVALVALLRMRPADRSWPEITAEVIEAGSALAVWRRIVPETLFESDAQALRRAEEDLAEWSRQGLVVVTVLDPDYPTRLRGVHQAPPVLFTRGQLVPTDRAVSVVGSREASAHGREIASEVARQLAAAGITVAAGLALGIDTAAHRATLDAGGRTVAFLGTGINGHYPPANRTLQDEIARRGLLVSQFWPDAPPQRHTFLMRNATMSGYGLATVVVEAGEHSGARAQARIAVEHGRPVILTDLVLRRNAWAQALEGRPGVHIASSLEDVLQILKEISRADRGVDQELHRLASAKA